MVDVTSLYEYTTVTDLEETAGQDYSGINAKYTDEIIAAQITLAERFVRSQLTEIPSTPTDGMIAATLIIAERLMHNLLVKDGRTEDALKALIDPYDIDVSAFLKKDEYSPVSSTPYSGVEPY